MVRPLLAALRLGMPDEHEGACRDIVTHMGMGIAWDVGHDHHRARFRLP